MGTDRSRWTPDLDRRLEALMREGFSYDDIGVLLDRGPKGVAARARKLRLTLRHSWSPGEDVELEALWETTLTCEEIAAQIGHGPPGGDRRGDQLGLRGVPAGWG